MPLKPGKRPKDDFDDSMAEAIESVFESEWHKRYGYDLPARGREDRKLLYVAIAQGVVKHLVAKAEPSLAESSLAEHSFRIHSVEVTQADSLISSSGTAHIGGHDYPADVKQDPGSAGQPNKVVSEDGIGKLEILAEGILEPETLDP